MVRTETTQKSIIPSQKNKTRREFLGWCAAGILTLTGCGPLPPTQHKKKRPPEPTEARPTPTHEITQERNRQGAYESVNIIVGNWKDVLKTASENGFSQIINYDILSATDVQQIKDFLDYAQLLKMKVIVKTYESHGQFLYQTNPSTTPYPNNANMYADLLKKSLVGHATGPVGTVADVLREIIQQVTHDHPAVDGYYFGDELRAPYHEHVREYVNVIRKADPKKPLWFVGNGMQLNAYVDLADVILFDTYPYGDTANGFMSPQTEEVQANTSIASQAHLLAKIVYQERKRREQSNIQRPLELGAVIQGHSFIPYDNAPFYPYNCQNSQRRCPWPTEEQIVSEADTALQALDYESEKKAGRQVHVFYYSEFDARLHHPASLLWLQQASRQIAQEHGWEYTVTVPANPQLTQT